MKKNYIKPITDKYIVSSINQLLAGSIDGDNLEGDGEQLSKGNGGGGSSNMWEWMDNDDNE